MWQITVEFEWVLGLGIGIFKSLGIRALMIWLPFLVVTVTKFPVLPDLNVLFTQRSEMRVPVRGDEISADIDLGDVGVKK